MCLAGASVLSSPPVGYLPPHNFFSAPQGHDLCTPQWGAGPVARPPGGRGILHNTYRTVLAKATLQQKLHHKHVKNLKLHFSDEVSDLCLMEETLWMKPVSPDFDKVASVLHVDGKDLSSECQIMRRLPSDLSTHDAMLDLVLSNDKQLMFPHLSAACRKILLLPIGTAAVERSFSTMNQIMTSKRCRLNPGHISQLMQLSIEGPEIPDIRDVVCEESDSEHDKF